MLTELQTMTSFECAPSFLTFNCSVNDGTVSTCLSQVDHVVSEQSAKKPTRQWAAWTRQEEESFFTALRQYGKNFEKITSRVQSKNKDQVRHYYYRLVRRMNKLLGPGLSLDAKNSKETIAAMLRWWSLLEKYSCKASKLHLKPRRFKLFVEALVSEEHQLVKDRKKSVKRRHSQVENYAPSTSAPVGNQTRAVGAEAGTVKLVLVDSQNIPKLVPGKVTSSSQRCTVNLGVSHGITKGDTSMGKVPRQRKRSGIASVTSLRKWEKAAIAGVSLVADAAEHLERAVFCQEPEQQLGEGDFIHPDNILPSLPQCQTVITECNAQSSVKLKLQLFPIDEATRRALETDKLNPFLELTLSNRKKISSVLEHLARKWGSSSIAIGKLMLFPYNAKKENLASSQGWCQDSCVSVGDINTSIGNPTVFRLRYGWIFPETDCSDKQAYISSHRDVKSACQEEQQIDFVRNLASSEEACLEMQNIHGISSYSPQNTKMDNNITAGSTKLGGTVIVSVGEWADSLTNMSIGDLLTEAPDENDINVNAAEQPISGNSEYFQQIPFTCDSFDAAIAAHIFKHQNKMGFPSAFTSTSSSFFDAEETCDAFSFRRKLNTSEDLSNIPEDEAMTLGNQTCLVVSDCSPEELSKVDNIPHSPQQLQVGGEDILDPNNLNESEFPKDLSGLTDLYWPDSLGPFDLELPSCNYHSADPILSDSLGGLIASSLDAFQSCSFFGTDKKVGSPAANGTS